MAGLEDLNVRYQLSTELYVVERSGLLGVANKKGQLLVHYEYDEISKFNTDGFASTKRGSKYGAIDKFGKIVFPCIIEKVLFKVDNFAVVQANSKNMIIDTKTYNKKCEYDEIQLMKSPYMQNFALIRNGEFKGVLDVINNREIIPCIYNSIEDFEETAYLVSKGDLKGILNKEGGVILECEYLQILEDKHDFALLVQNEAGKWGVVNKTTGRELVPCEFDAVEPFSAEDDFELRLVYKDGKMGIYNSAAQEEVVPCIYDMIQPDHNLGIIHVKKGDKYGLLNERGEVIVDCVADKQFTKVNEHFMKGGNIYLSVVTKQIFTKEQFELMSRLNAGKIDYKNLPDELLSSARCLKELVELARYDLKNKEELEAEDVDGFIDFTSSLLDQKKRFEMNLCTENTTGLSFTEVQEFADLCSRNIEVLSNSFVHIRELEYEDPENGSNGGSF